MSSTPHLECPSRTFGARVRSLTVEIQTAANDPKRYQVVFIGSGGRTLAVSRENPASYGFSGSEGYVRARIEDSGGLKAWTQPVFLEARR